MANCTFISQYSRMVNGVDVILFWLMAYYFTSPDPFNILEQAGENFSLMLIAFAGVHLTLLGKTSSKEIG